MAQTEITRSKKKRNWELEVLPHVKEELQNFYKEGIVPTLRTIFYRLASRNIIRNVQNDYAYLSEFTAKCRKRDVCMRRLKIKGAIKYGLLDEHIEILKSHGLLIQYHKSRHGFRDDTISDELDKKEYILKLDAILPINSFADETRGAFGDFIDEYKSPEEFIKENLDFLTDLPNQYKNMIPRWHDQPYYVELWTEKNAMVGTFRSILKDLDVRIVYNRGFDSVSNGWETYQRIKNAWEKGKKVRILYCGDLDPSGDSMDEIINEFMKICFAVEDYKERGLYDFKRIGVLYLHIAKFELPKNPDPQVLAKLREDRRKERFKQKYGLRSDDDLFQIEIDALAAYAPLEFKNMIINEIKPYYNRQIYERLLSNVNHSEDQISIHVRKNVQHFIVEQYIKSFMESIF